MEGAPCQFSFPQGLSPALMNINLLLGSCERYTSSGQQCLSQFMSTPSRLRPLGAAAAQTLEKETLLAYNDWLSLASRIPFNFKYVFAYVSLQLSFAHAVHTCVGSVSRPKTLQPCPQGGCGPAGTPHTQTERQTDSVLSQSVPLGCGI
jgi:hypothetical protein